jgi:hypothetical protein
MMDGSLGMTGVDGCPDHDAAPEALRFSRTTVRPYCEEWVGDNPISGAPVPPTVPGEFVVQLGAVVSGETLCDLEEEMAGLGGAEAATAGLLSLLEWVELEARGFDDLVEGLRLLRGAVMVAGAAGQGGPGAWPG